MLKTAPQRDTICFAQLRDKHPNPMESPAAHNFGRYQILAEIGRGAMGVVYKALDPKIDRTVAIKTIALSEHAATQNKEFRERFVVEAKAAGRLSHPSIVTVYDVGEDTENQNPFIVMEYIEGESLDQQLSATDGFYEPDRALSLVQDLANALDYAHSQGIVHRDIKPANILLTTDGRPKITDFGVAKLNMAYQTMAGQSLGTPAYMSPEQLNGDSVDGRSDLFSLGVILYTLLTGHRPFQGNSAMTVSFRVVHREPLPVSAYDSDFPPDVDYVIGRAIAKDAGHRYQSGKEMADDLDDLREGRTPRSKEKHPPPALPAASKQNLSSTVTSTQRSGGLKVSRARSNSTPAPHQWSMWEYAALVLLAMGATAMGISIFRPMATSDLGVPASPSASASRSATTRASARLSAAPSERNLDDTRANAAVAAPATRNRAPLVAKTRATSAAPLSQHPIATKFAHETARETGSETNPSVESAMRSTLHIRVEHRFPSAEVLVWVDDQLAYRDSSNGTVKRRMGLFKAIKGYKSDSLRVAAGEHKIRVRVQSSDNAYDRTASITGKVPANAERELRIDCTNRKQIHLTMQ